MSTAMVFVGIFLFKNNLKEKSPSKFDGLLILINYLDMH